MIFLYDNAHKKVIAQNQPRKLAAFRLRLPVIRFILCIAFFCNAGSLLANHVKGGYIRYEYLGAGSATGTSQYKVTVTVFYGCGVNGPKASVTLRALDASTGSSVLSTTISTTTSATVSKSSYNPCLSNPPTICYEVYTYVTTLTLTDNTAGYELAVTDQYRTANIINIASSSSTGIAFTAQIPGVINGTDYHTNTSPEFAFKDTAIVCYNGTFTYQFSASDAVNNDSLSYAFGSGLNSTSTGTTPFFAPLTYNSGFSGASPMGSGVAINPVTGLISGTAPATTGEYVIAVYVTEWRNGVAITSIKKELQIYVYNCSLTAAALNPSYINCNDFTFQFSNESTASNITSYHWDFGVPTITTDVSTQATPSYTYPDTGTFNLKLKVANAGGCEDSTTAVVKVYPGFFPGFTVTGSCYQSPFTFTDTTRTRYGVVNSRAWNFGDPTGNNNTAITQTATHQYATAGNATVTLIVGSDKGCIDTVSKTVVINDKPQIHLPFTDTLICSGDRLPLSVQTTGTSFSWSPLYNINNPTTANPTVYPDDTTVYTITVRENACVDSAKVTVNVLDFITVHFAGDTAICATDTITLRPISDALSYLWTESGSGNSLISTTIKYPKADPLQTTTYYVSANLGHCQAAAQTTVYVSPYPSVSVSADTSICYGTKATLHGYTNTPYFTWTPAGGMLNATTLNPTVSPQITTTYSLRVTDTFYCPKPSTATTIVRIIPQVVVNAGNDTAIVIGQPLQLNATASADSASFVWSPATWLSNTYIHNPKALIGSAIDSIHYTVTATTPEGCSGSDGITVKVFTTLPDFFIPSGFTPNGDGLNDVFKPIVAGIAEFRYFRVFSRWGQLVFETTQAGKGWDGTINGNPQPAGTYVVSAAGTDYTGRLVEKKGTVVLIR